MNKSLYDIYDYFLIFLFFYIKPIFVYLGIEHIFINLFTLFSLKIIFILNYIIINFNLLFIKFLFKIFPSFLLKTFSIAALSFTFKFIMLISLFIFSRGGIPRYRYDFLTKVG